MGLKILWRMPEISWERVTTASQVAVQSSGASASATLVLSNAWSTSITVDIEPRMGSLLRRGIDYTVSDRVVVFEPGQTRKTVTVSMLPSTGFRKTAHMELVARKRKNRGTKGDYSVCTWTLYGNGEPPVATFGTDAAETDKSSGYTSVVTLDAASREQTDIPVTLGGTLTKTTHYTLSGAYWNDALNQIEIPAGKTSAQLDVQLLGTAGTVTMSLNVPADNTLRNLLTFSKMGTPEHGVLAGTESQIDFKNATDDDVGHLFGVPTDWEFGGDTGGPSNQLSLAHSLETLADPNGLSTSILWASPHDNDGGSTAYGYCGKSTKVELVGGHAIPKIQTGHNILSFYMKNDGAPGGFSQAPYSRIMLVNEDLAVTHSVAFQWTAGVPAITETSLVDYSGVTDEGSGWYRIWLIYDAPASEDGDLADFRVQPCWHPSQDVSLNQDKGAYIWGAQFEVDPTQLVVAPTAYQVVEEYAQFAGSSVQGADPLLTLTGV